MTNMNLKVISCTILTAIVLFWGCENKPQAPKTAMNQGLPQDVLVSCTVAPDTFNSWFASGKPTENGKVKPANSVTFPHTNNCSFYQWSEQMFLWLTSPATGDKYTPGNTVMESDLFYDVSESVNGKRTLTAHKPGSIITVSNSITENGPDDLPMVADDKGRLLEVEQQQPEKNHGKAMAMSAKGVMAEIDHAEPGPDSLHHIFKDKAGRVIEHPKAILQHKMNQGMIVEEIKMGDRSIFLDTAGNEVNISVGQATGNVLMAQNGSLVYYVMMVNDVYAYYLSAYKDSFMKSPQFPTTAASRDSICAYARKNGVASLPDSDALAMEIKLALVETTNLKDAGTYVTINAQVPVYDTSNKYKWTPTGKFRMATLALIGLHVVGSLADHPEMSWATFEHKNNVPNGAYQYLNTKNETITVPADTGKGWLLCASSTDQPYNVAYMKNKKNVIDTVGGHSISASSTNLKYPFGTQMGTITNPQDLSSAAANSKVISINNAVINMLQGNDLRKNYIFIGDTWTKGGAIPNGKSYSATDTAAGAAVGSNILANSTMETYFQRTDTSCFYCHHGNSLAASNLSHIFSSTTPLQPSPAVLKK